MALTDTAIRKAKPTGKRKRLTDSGGLCLEIAPEGGKWWRLRYRFVGGGEYRVTVKAVAGYERLTGRTFPKLKPNDRFREAPTFYVANHTAVLGDGEEMWWPSHTKALDFELELACVLAEPLVDATPEEALCKRPTPWPVFFTICAARAFASFTASPMSDTRRSGKLLM